MMPRVSSLCRQKEMSLLIADFNMPERNCFHVSDAICAIAVTHLISGSEF